MVISSIVGAMALLFFTSSLQATRQADGHNEQAAAARATMQSWTALLRVAVDKTGSSAPGVARFYSAAPAEIMFCAAVNSKMDDPDVKPPVAGIRLAIEEGQLVEQRWTNCATMPGGASAVWRVVAPRAAPLDDGWLITPLLEEDLPLGDEVNCVSLGSCLTYGDDPLTSIELAEIAGVKIAFTTPSNPLRPAETGTYTTVTTLLKGSS